MKTTNTKKTIELHHEGMSANHPYHSYYALDADSRKQITAELSTIDEVIANINSDIYDTRKGHICRCW